MRLGHKGMPGREQLVYAVLDNCSKACFIREDIVEEMRLPIARSTSLKVKTMIGVKMDKNIINIVIFLITFIITIACNPR